MHYSNLVIIEKVKGDEIEDKVEEAMGPSSDGGGGFWDWFQIGGRWTGYFDGYDPEKDPRNIETCDLCKGTGMRSDAIAVNARAANPDFTCNGCEGTGKRVTWPTRWARHDGDVIPVEDLTEKHASEVYRIVLHDRGAFEKERYLPWREKIEDKFERAELPPLSWIKKEYAGCLAVIVDNHN